MLALVASACGTGGEGDTEGSLLERAREQGITIGFANERPYGFENAQGEPDGEAPTVALEVLSRMGITDVESVVVEFEALINGLNAGRYDMVAAGMFITRDRASQALFSDPDYCGTTAFAVPAGNPQGLTDFSSVAGNSDVRLGVLSGAVELGYATSSGVPEGQINQFAATADMVDALTAGRIDAFALTTPTVQDQVADLDGFEATQGFIPVVDGEEVLGCGGFVFRFEDIEFRDAFNDELVELREAGEILPLVEEFGFSSVEVDAAKGVTVEDLIGEPYDFAVE